MAILILIVFSMTLHEFAHAWTANYLGDDTAKQAGRLSLNPIRHLGDSLFWAPVPVDRMRLSNPTYSIGIVCIAGPATNLILALLLWALGWHMGARLNVIIALLNLMPIGSLDGKHIWTALLMRMK